MAEVEEEPVTKGVLCEGWRRRDAVGEEGICVRGGNAWWRTAAHDSRAWGKQEGGTVDEPCSWISAVHFLFPTRFRTPRAPNAATNLLTLANRLLVPPTLRKLARRPRLPSAVTARAAVSTRRAGACGSVPTRRSFTTAH